MICHYCRAQNSADDHRCRRCGRRLSEEQVRFPVQAGALAPVLDPASEPAATTPAEGNGPRLAPAARPAQNPGPREPVQPSLFGPMPVSKRDPGRIRVAQPARRKSEPALQQHFEFGDGVRVLPTSVDAAVYCNAPVALASDRVAAAAIDVLIPLCGFAAFFAAAHYTAGEIHLDKKSIPLIGTAAALIMLFYRAVCCLGNMDTPGVQWAGLRLLDFDGRLPTRRARMFRFAGGIVSIVSAGIGLLWSLADEERLTWHDHMSRTFPTPRFVKDR